MHSDAATVRDYLDELDDDRPEDLRRDLIAETIAAMPPMTLIARHEQAHPRP